MTRPAPWSMKRRAARGRRRRHSHLALESLESRAVPAALVAAPDTYTVAMNERLFVGPTGRTTLSMQSDVGDYIGLGKTYTLDPVGGTFTASGINDGVRFAYSGNEPVNASWWNLAFAGPQGSGLQVGTYADVVRYPFQPPTAAGMDISGEGRGSNELSGTFRVLAVAYDSDGVAERFHATFEQHGEHAGPALRGEFLYGMPTDLPGVLANDTAADASLSVTLATPPAHGRVALRRDGSFVYKPESNYFGTDTFRYVVTDGGRTSDSATVTIAVVPTGVRLAILGTVPDSVAGHSLGIRVAVRDAAGNIIRDDNSTTLVLEVGSGPGALVGVTTARAVDGVATFNAAAIQVAGRHTLRVRGGGAAAETNAFRVVPAAPAGLAIRSMTAYGTAGSAIRPAIAVAVVDAFGNVAATARRRLVTIAVASGPGGFTTPRLTRAFTASGRVTFSGLIVAAAGEYTFRVTSPGLAAVVSSPFLATAATRVSLVVNRGVGVAEAPVKLVARVAVERPAVGIPTGGSVTFLDGDTILGTADLVRGRATLDIAGLADGRHALRAIYGGAAGLRSSVSRSLTYVVTPSVRSPAGR